MKKIISFLILGCLSLYGFSINPIDPPAKTGEAVKTITPQSPVTTEECSNLRSTVTVTVIITITDCPDYTCDYPANCSFNICIYDENYTLIRCQSFDLDQCSYTFEDTRAEEGTYLYSKLVPAFGCSSCYNSNFNKSTGVVPIGGGTVYINQTFCCK